MVAAVADDRSAVPVALPILTKSLGSTHEASPDPLPDHLVLSLPSPSRLRVFPPTSNVGIPSPEANLYAGPSKSTGALVPSGSSTEGPFWGKGRHEVK